MANLAKSQAEWTAFFREFTQVLRLHKILDGIGRRFLGNNIRPLELNEGAGVLSLWTFSGAIRGVNCDEGGQLFVSLLDETPGAAQARVSVWSDSAKTAKVAEGDAADGATITLAEQNNSGLTGTVKLGTVAASDTDIIILLDIDEERKAIDTFGLTDGSSDAFRAHLARLELVRSTIGDLASGSRSEIEANFFLTAFAEFSQSATLTIISALEETDANEDVQVTYTGLLPELDDAMNDETSSVAQTVEKNIVAAAAAIFDADNTGLGAVVHLAQREHARIGTVTFRCTSGKVDTLEELFAVTILDGDGNPLSARLSLKIKKEWESALFGIRLRLDRTITDTLDAGNQVDTYVVNGETLDNTDAGKLYLELTDVAGTRTVKWYSNASKTTLVAQGSKVGDGVVTMVEQASSGITGSCNVTYATDDLDIVVNLNPFLEGDSFTVVVTNDEAGRIQTLIKNLWGFSLNSAAAGAETIPDLMVEEAADHITAVS